jgi:hypothetical protein
MGPRPGDGRRATRRARPGRSDGSRRSLARLPIAIAIVAALAAAVVFDQGRPDRPVTAPASAAPVPAIPSPDALSVSWYCAEGTATVGGRADETILVANVGVEDAEAVVTVLTGGDGRAARERVEVPARDQIEVQLADVVEEPEELGTNATLVGPGVVVEAFGGQVVVEHIISRDDDLAMGPCSRTASSEWYFAGGTTVRGTEMTLALFNPFGDDAIVDLTYLTDTGVQTPEPAQALVVPRRSRVAVLVHEHVRRQPQVATLVRARTGRVVAEQSVAFDGSEGPPGLTLSLGSTAPGRTWSLPFGATGADRTHTVTAANFSETDTEVEVAVLLDDNETIEPEVVAVAGRSVVTVDVAALVPVGSLYAVEVRALGNAPVVVEELLTSVMESEGGAALDFGIPGPARRWAFAGAGDTGESTAADTVLSVLNPGRDPVTVRLLAYVSGDLDPPGGASEQVVAPGERTSFALSELDIEPDQVLVVESDGAVFAQRVLLTETGRSLAPGIRG